MSALLIKSWKDLSRRKVRTVLTVLTVALGVMGIGLFAITPLADRAVKAELAAENMHNVGIRLNGIILTEGQLDHLEGLANVDRVSQQLVLPVKVDVDGRAKAALLIGLRDYGDQAVDVIRVVSGVPPKGMEVLTDQSNAINSVVELSAGQAIIARDPNEVPVRLKVSGVGKNFVHGGAARSGTPVFYTSMEAAERIGGRTGFTYLGFSLEDTNPSVMNRTVEVIRRDLASRTSVVTFDDLADVREEGYWEGREIFGTLMGFVGILAILILFVSLFLISNTMNTMVSEQAREIAMMKAIGATRGTVFRSFLTTSAIVGLLGSGVGAALGIPVAHLVGSTFAFQGFGYRPPFAVHWPTVGVSIAIGVGVVLAASLPALFRTLRISVVKGLESHGISADYGQSFLDRTLMGIRGLPRVVQMGIRNALRRKGRSIATILQVAFAVGVVIAMLNLGDGLTTATVKAYDVMQWDLWARVADSPTNPTTVSQTGRLARIEGVASAEPVMTVSTELRDRMLATFGYPQDTRAVDYERTLLERGQGRWWTPDEAKAAAHVVVIGEALSKFENIALGDTMELMTATGLADFKVIGIDTSFTNNGQFVYMPLETLQDVLEKGRSVNGFYLFTDTQDHRAIDTTARRVQGDLEGDGHRTSLMLNYVAAEQNVTQNKALSNLFLAVSFIIVLIVLIGLVSTLVMNILDRTTEIGMLRCIGAQSRDVRRVFSSEGMFLAFLGWIVGLPVGYGVSQIMVVAMQSAMKLTLPLEYTPAYMGWSLVFALVGTLMVIALPLRRATKMKPGDALRYE